MARIAHPEPKILPRKPADLEGNSRKRLGRPAVAEDFNERNIRAACAAFSMKSGPWLRACPPRRRLLLFLQGDLAIQPDPDHLESCQIQAGQRRGQWPSSPEISATMLARYGRPES
jgi:hypothetical protein